MPTSEIGKVRQEPDRGDLLDPGPTGCRDDSPRLGGKGGGRSPQGAARFALGSGRSGWGRRYDAAGSEAKPAVGLGGPIGGVADVLGNARHCLGLRERGPPPRSSRPASCFPPCGRVKVT